MNIKLIGLALSASAFLGMTAYIYILRSDIKVLKGEISGLEKDLEESTLDMERCSLDKALTERVSNDYKNANVALRRERDRLRNNPACVVPKPSSPPSVSSGEGNQLSSSHGIRVNWLYDFAGDAEQDRLTATACVDFVTQLYESRGLN